MKLSVLIPHWHNEAICAQIGGLMWLPSATASGSMIASEKAKRICLTCPVRLKCGIEGIELKDEFAIRAGFSTHTSSGRTELRKWVAEQVAS